RRTGSGRLPRPLPCRRTRLKAAGRWPWWSCEGVESDARRGGRDATIAALTLGKKPISSSGPLEQRRLPFGSLDFAFRPQDFPRPVQAPVLYGAGFPFRMRISV